MTSQKVVKSTNFSGVARILGLALLAFFCALFVHLANHEFLASDNPEALRDGISVRTADDASYIRPALNFIETGVWKGANPGLGGYVLRSPGYGMIYGVFSYLSDATNGLWAMVLFQLILWSLAVGAIPFLARSLGFTEKVSWWLAVFISLMPMFYGFLSYTLTEALTPSLVVFFYTFLFLGIERNRKLLLVSAIALGFLILLRPAMILLVISYLPFYSLLKKRLVSVLLISLLPIFLWQVRVHRFIGRFDLHPIYQTDAADLYRPLHKAAWGFHKMTGQTGVEFHQSMGMLWQAAEGAISEGKAINGTIEKLDGSVLQTFSRDELTEFYSQYIAVLRQQVPYQLANQPINHSLTGEADLSKRFDLVKKEYVSDNFTRAWLVGPATVVKELTVHSNLSLYLFQKPLRGNVLIELLRWLSLLVHLFTYLLAFVFLFRKKSSWYTSIWLPAMLFFFYLIFIQRGIEERYMLPYLIPLFLLAIHTVNSLFPGRVKGIINQTP
ncbi:hypothetical protein O3Q51_15085 [Cryomorphaceae bacterium 1068]|nr:hypothetical protein [Cryomorphaceae bacterium 1068]